MSETDIIASQSMTNWNGNGNQNSDTPPADATVGLGTGGDILNVSNSATLTINGYLNLNAGTVNITDGATISVTPAGVIGGDLTNAAGGTVNINNGTLLVSNEFNGNQGVYNITNGKLSVGNDFNGNQAVYNINSGGILNAGTNYTDINSSNINIKGGSVYFSGIANIDGGGKIDFHNIAGGLLEIDSTSLSDLSGDGLNIENFVYGDQIKIKSTTDYSSDTFSTQVSGNDLLIQVTADGKTTTIVTLKGFATTSDANAIPDAAYKDGYILFGEQSATGACFLTGTLIETSKGKQAVEDIQAGDTLMVYRHGKTETCRVIWTGHQHTIVNMSLPEDEAGYPVRVSKDAISEGVPYKDMLVTAEHCLFFDGKFIPVRMLVNGKSIAYDLTITAYDYYHVETETHSIINADGVLTESYLNTGNRNRFCQDDGIFRLSHEVKTWANDAAAPLTTTRQHVEPVFKQIAARTGINMGKHRFIQDHDCHLETLSGTSIRPIRTVKNRLIFMIPSCVNAFHLVSRSSRPSDVVGPFVDDRRQLGVCVGEISLQIGTKELLVTPHLQQQPRSGWHNGDVSDDTRWTDGCALLMLPQHNAAKAIFLSIEIRAAGPYLMEQAVENGRRLSA